MADKVGSKNPPRRRRHQKCGSGSPDGLGRSSRKGTVRDACFNTMLAAAQGIGRPRYVVARDPQDCDPIARRLSKPCLVATPAETARPCIAVEAPDVVDAGDAPAAPDVKRRSRNG